jgi:DNA-binding protein HU-beta
MFEHRPITETALIEWLSAKSGVPAKGVSDLLAGLAELAARETNVNRAFVLPGIGRVVRMEREARQGVNLATGEVVPIPGKKLLKFRFAADFAQKALAK